MQMLLMLRKPLMFQGLLLELDAYVPFDQSEADLEVLSMDRIGSSDLGLE